MLANVDTDTQPKRRTKRKKGGGKGRKPLQGKKLPKGKGEVKGSASSKYHGGPWPGGVNPEEEIRAFIVWEENTLFHSEELSKFNPFFSSYLSQLKEARVDHDILPLSVKDFGALRQKHNAGADQDNTYVESEVRSYLANAAVRRASDVHIDIFQGHGEIRLRVDGQMVRLQETRSEIANRILSVAFSFCDVGQSSYNKTDFLSGRFEAKHLPEGVQGIRLETGPHHQGHWMALRLLWETQKIEGELPVVLQTLGFSEQNAKALSVVSELPSGLNIFSGPTGSGKTTTLKHMLEATATNRPDLQITTLEDPPEVVIEGTRQLKITATEADKREDAFEKMLRTVLRANPDVVMVGEVRGPRSAGLVLDTAMTGHLMYTTLHSTGSFNILERLSRMLGKYDKCPPMEALTSLCNNNIISSLIFQRLTPTLCKHCKVKLMDKLDEMSPGRILNLLAAYKLEEAKDILAQFNKGTKADKLAKKHEEVLENIHIHNSEGCEKCIGTGVHGRTVLAEVVLTDAELYGWIKENGVTYARQQWLKSDKRHGLNGGQTIQGHARQKIQQGLVDPTQVEQRIGNIAHDYFIADDRLDLWEVELMGLE